MDLLKHFERTLDGGLANLTAFAYTGQHKTEKRGHISVHQAGFEPKVPIRTIDRALNVTIPAFDWTD